MSAEGAIAVTTLTDGGQKPIKIASEIVAFLSGARESLDIATYDIKLAPDTSAAIEGAIEAAAERGVSVRLAFNHDHDRPIAVPPPSQTDESRISALGVPTRAIPGIPDLMHHKYVVRDGEQILTGSTNWTDDSWSREENVIVTVSSAAIAGAYSRDFDQLWGSGVVAGSGDVDPNPVEVGAATVRPWFCPDRGSDLAHRIAKAIGRARRRVRIASPVLTSGPVLGTLAEVASDGRVDVAGVVDATQIRQVYDQWEEGGHARWKLVSIGQVFSTAPFAGKPSTPYTPDSVHDYMHAKVTVADDVVFIGSFNLSHSGEMNAENVLEIEDAGLAEQMALYIDAVRGRYPAAPVPG